MRKPEDFDKVQPYEERRKLPAGGYVCEIKKAEETKSKSGKEMVKLAIDICEGDFKGYFFDDFTRAKSFRDDVKWPYEGTVWQLVFDKNGNTHRMFKALITSIEAENIVISWDEHFEKSIRGAKIGVIFGEEETESTNGNVYWRTVPRFFCTCEDVRTGRFQIPKPRPLEKPVDTLSWTNGSADSFAAAETDIPF